MEKYNRAEIKKLHSQGYIHSIKLNIDNFISHNNGAEEAVLTAKDSLHKMDAEYLPQLADELGRLSSRNLGNNTELISDINDVLMLTLSTGIHRDDEKIQKASLNAMQNLFSNNKFSKKRFRNKIESTFVINNITVSEHIQKRLDAIENTIKEPVKSSIHNPNISTDYSR